MGARGGAREKGYERSYSTENRCFRKKKIANFTIIFETNGKIGLFLNTLNPPKSPILPLVLPKSGCLGTKKSVVEHVANISSAYHDDEYMVNIRSATPFRSTISNARQTRSLGTPMRLNYKHLYTSGRKQLN